MNLKYLINIDKQTKKYFHIDWIIRFRLKDHFIRLEDSQDDMDYSIQKINSNQICRHYKDSYFHYTENSLNRNICCSIHSILHTHFYIFCKHSYLHCTENSMNRNTCCSTHNIPHIQYCILYIHSYLHHTDSNFVQHICYSTHSRLHTLLYNLCKYWSLGKQYSLHQSKLHEWSILGSGQRSLQQYWLSWNKLYYKRSNMRKIMWSVTTAIFDNIIMRIQCLFDLVLNFAVNIWHFIDDILRLFFIFYIKSLVWILII